MTTAAAKMPPPTEGPTDAARERAGGDGHESMGEPELLALIVEMRLSAAASAGHSAASGRSTSSAGPSKEKKQQQSNSAAAPNSAPGSAVESNQSEGTSIDTMDLCHRKIHKLPEEMVDIIKDEIVRLALGYNFITALPNSFVNLSKLRYLNIRANLISTFPTVLCSLPSLEILDMSRNKIRKFPSEPGRLTELRVLSIANNRLRKLPAWLPKLRQLRILKVDGNPINWPPPHVTVMPALDKVGVNDGAGPKSTTEEAQAKDKTDKTNVSRKKAEDKHMLVWITQLKSWIEENGEKNEAHGMMVTPSNSEDPRLAPPKGMQETDDATSTAALTPGDAIVRSESQAEPASKIVDAEGGSDDEKGRDGEVIALQVPTPTTPHAAAPISTPLAKESLQTHGEVSAEAQVTRDAPSASPKEPSLRREESLAISVPKRSYSPPPPSPLKAKAIVPPLPTQSPKAFVSSASVPSQVSPSLPSLTDLNTNSSDASALPSLRGLHQRNNSHSFGQADPNTRALRSNGGLSSKKSLPDMRHGISAITPGQDKQKQSAIRPSDDVLEASLHESAAETSSARRMKRSPVLATQSELPPHAERATDHPQHKMLAPIITSSAAQDHAVLIENETAAPAASTNPSGGHSTLVEAVESERNSYFKRLSTLPTSTISLHVSVPVLLCIDATRGVLYALSQMYTALRQYVAFATEERMTSQLSRVLDIAGGSMANLIDSLDRFDSLSRIKGAALDPAVVRGVVVSSIESIGTFRKLVHIVQLQLKSFQRGADIRYTRTLLLLLYGSLAEIANSWKTMEPLLGDVAPYLMMADSSTTHASNASLEPSSSHHTLHTYAPSTLPSIAEAASPVTPSSRPRAILPTSRPQRRRHAGSFSAQDIAQGATMASVGEAMPSATATYSGSASVTSTPVSEDRRGKKAANAYSTASDGPEGPSGGIVNGSSALPDKGQDGSRRTLSNTTSASRGAGMYMNSRSTGVDSPPIDDHLLILVVKITSVAFSVWAGIEDHLVSLGLPAAATGQSIKASIAMMTSNRSGSSDGVGYPQSESGTSQKGSKPSRSARIQASEASTIGDASIASMPETPTRAKALQSNEGTDSTSAQSQQHQHSDSASLPASLPSPAVQRRLRQLHDLTRGVNEHTHRLHVCLERTQDALGHTAPLSPLSPQLGSNSAASLAGGTSARHPRTGSTVSSNSNGNSSGNITLSETEQRQAKSVSGSETETTTKRSNPAAATVSASASTADSRELFSESGNFIKSVLQISQFIKSLSAEGFTLPKYVKASIAELTTCARDLTLHLHFLSGPKPSMPLATAPSSVGHFAALPPPLPSSKQKPANASISPHLTSAPAVVSTGTSLQQQQQQQQQQE